MRGVQKATRYITSVWKSRREQKLN